MIEMSDTTPTIDSGDRLPAVVAPDLDLTILSDQEISLSNNNPGSHVIALRPHPHGFEDDRPGNLVVPKTGATIDLRRSAIPTSPDSNQTPANTGSTVNLRPAYVHVPQSVVANVQQAPAAKALELNAANIDRAIYDRAKSDAKAIANQVKPGIRNWIKNAFEKATPIRTNKINELTIQLADAYSRVSKGTQTQVDIDTLAKHGLKADRDDLLRDIDRFEKQRKIVGDSTTRGNTVYIDLQDNTPEAQNLRLLFANALNSSPANFEAANEALYQSIQAMARNKLAVPGGLSVDMSPTQLAERLGEFRQRNIRLQNLIDLTGGMVGIESLGEVTSLAPSIPDGIKGIFEKLSDSSQIKFFRQQRNPDDVNYSKTQQAMGVAGLAALSSLNLGLIPIQALAKVGMTAVASVISIAALPPVALPIAIALGSAGVSSVFSFLKSLSTVKHRVSGIGSDITRYGLDSVLANQKVGGVFDAASLFARQEFSNLYMEAGTLLNRLANAATLEEKADIAAQIVARERISTSDIRARGLGRQSLIFNQEQILDWNGKKGPAIDLMQSEVLKVIDAVKSNPALLPQYEALIRHHETELKKLDNNLGKAFEKESTRVRRNTALAAGGGALGMIGLRHGIGFLASHAGDLVDSLKRAIKDIDNPLEDVKSKGKDMSDFPRNVEKPTLSVSSKTVLIPKQDTYSFDKDTDPAELHKHGILEIDSTDAYDGSREMKGWNFDMKGYVKMPDGTLVEFTDGKIPTDIPAGAEIKIKLDDQLANGFNGYYKNPDGTVEEYKPIIDMLKKSGRTHLEPNEIKMFMDLPGEEGKMYLQDLKIDENGMVTIPKGVERIGFSVYEGGELDPADIDKDMIATFNSIDGGAALPGGKVEIGTTTYEEIKVPGSIDVKFPKPVAAPIDEPDFKSPSELPEKNFRMKEAIAESRSIPAYSAFAWKNPESKRPRRPVPSQSNIVSALSQVTQRVTFPHIPANDYDGRISSPGKPITSQDVINAGKKLNQDIFRYGAYNPSNPNNNITFFHRFPHLLDDQGRWTSKGQELVDLIIDSDVELVSDLYKGDYEKVVRLIWDMPQLRLYDSNGDDLAWADIESQIAASGQRNITQAEFLVRIYSCFGDIVEALQY